MIGIDQLHTTIIEVCPADNKAYLYSARNGRKWKADSTSMVEASLYELDGTIPASHYLSPQPHRTWREKLNTIEKDVGEPCAGEPHARFYGRELETECRGYGHRRCARVGSRGDERRAYCIRPLPCQFPTLPSP